MKAITRPIGRITEKTGTAAGTTSIMATAAKQKRQSQRSVFIVVM